MSTGEMIGNICCGQNELPFKLGEGGAPYIKDEASEEAVGVSWPRQFRSLNQHQEIPSGGRSGRPGLRELPVLLLASNVRTHLCAVSGAGFAERITKLPFCDLANLMKELSDLF